MNLIMKARPSAKFFVYENKFKFCLDMNENQEP